jgi:flagellar assembly protein FliH
MSELREPLQAAAFSFAALEAPPDLSIPVGERLREAEDVLRHAREQAEGHRAQAREEGWQEGWAQGHGAGRSEALEGVQPAAAALTQATVALQAATAQLSQQMEGAAVELALRIAEQALGAALDVAPQRVLDAVRGALRRLVERDRVLLLVHPDDLELVRAGIDAIVGELGGVDHCEVQAERRVARGGAIVQTHEGEVDATLATKLARAREVIERELGDR